MTTSGSGEQQSGIREGPIFDRAMRQIAEGDPAAFCSWLGAEPDGAVRLEPGSFPSATLHADLLARIGPDRLLHVEYQRRPEAGLAIRMLGYRAQIMRRHTDMRLTQFVIILGDGQVRSCDDPEIGFRLGLRVTYLRDLPPEPLLARAGLAPLAVLAAGDQTQRAVSLARAFRVIRTQTVAGPAQDHLLEAAAVLATIRLDRPTIDKIQEESAMTVESIADFYSETNIGRELLNRGQTQGVTAMFEALLQDRFGDDPRIVVVAEKLARWPHRATAVHAVTQAPSLDALGVMEPPE